MRCPDRCVLVCTRCFEPRSQLRLGNRGQVELHAAARHSSELGRHGFGEQHEDGRLGWFFKSLQEHRRSQPGEMEIGDHDNLARSFARTPVRHFHDPARIVDGQLGPRTLDLDQIRVDPREHSAASVAMAAAP